MLWNSPLLSRYRGDVYSQNGEDGVLLELLRRLGQSERALWCVEFGAADGKRHSNTFALVEQGWSAVYIEMDDKTFAQLQETVAAYPKIVPIHAAVARRREDPNSLNALLSKTALPQEFAILSIDIDSYDLDVWESFTDYTPQIVVIEVNSKVPPHIAKRHTEPPSEPRENSFYSTCKVAREKGYTLVEHTGNCIFVRDDLVPRLNLPTRILAEPLLLFRFLFLPPEQIQYLKKTRRRLFWNYFLTIGARALRRKK